jgi:hypothetical protein
MKKILATMLLGALPALSSITFAQEMTEQSSNRLEARLNPVIAVDASGQARLDIAAGVTNDRFTAEVDRQGRLWSFEHHPWQRFPRRSGGAAHLPRRHRHLQPRSAVLEKPGERYYLRDRYPGRRRTRIAGGRCGARECKRPFHTARQIRYSVASGPL